MVVLEFRFFFFRYTCFELLRSILRSTNDFVNGYVCDLKLISGRAGGVPGTAVT